MGRYGDRFKMIVLRPDQVQLKADIYSGWQTARNVLGVLPTGGGKSVIVSDIALDNHNQNLQQIIIAHRTELVSQMSLHIATRGIPHRVIAPDKIKKQIAREHFQTFGQSFVNPTALCSVGGVDTLKARAADLKGWAQQVDRWVIDEAHHVLRENKWGVAVEMFPNAYGLGVTATPSRADGKGLGDHSDGVFGYMATGPDMRTLIELGALTDYEIVVPVSDFQIDEASVAKSGDFSSARMREASKKSHITGDVVIEYMRYAAGKRAICFATDVATANEIADRFNAAGISAAAVSAKTSTEIRVDAIQRFRNGRYEVLVNVDLFGEGFDVPACECVIMARPTASLGVFLQQFGRGLRTAPGKEIGLIIDHVSNYKRHGLPDKPHYWTLDRRDKRAKQEKDPDDIELTPCPECSRPFEKCFTVCPHCGFELLQLTPVRSGPEFIDGDLCLLDRDALELLRQQAELESPAAVGNKVALVTGMEYAGVGVANRQIEKIQAQTELKNCIAQWAGNGRAAGRGDSEMYRRFYLTTGVDVLTALTQSRQDMEKLAETVKGWN